MLCALIMAGGKGERFWPLSTDEKPKQFLKLLGDDTMIQMTVKRMQRILPIERIFIVTASQYVELVKEQLPRLPYQNIIVEPIGRNTAPCIALSAFHIQKYYKDSTIAVVPSDHLIADEDKFTNIINGAYKFIKTNNNAIITLGVVPDRPETGYGYIKYNETFSSIDNTDIFSVNSFKEKPDEEKAKRYISEGNYLWNCGMFIWKASTILKLTKKYLNSTYKLLEEIACSNEDEYNATLNIKYQQIESISVDYGIMENAKEIHVIPCEFGWDDIGTWHSLERYRDQDEYHNILVGDITNLNSDNNIIIGNNKQIVIVGLHDIFVVENENMIFIGKKEHIEIIKEIKSRVS